MWGLGLPGLGLAGALRSSTAIPGLVFTLPISSGVWDAYEAPSDADTRHTYARLVIPRQPAYDFGPYRGPDPAGNLAQIGLMTWTGSYYEWLSTGQADFGSPVYNRLARRVASPVGAWEWITGAGDLKPFTASNKPDAPTGSWAALSTGVVRVTLDAWVGNGRTVTSAHYDIGAGSVSFTPAAASTVTVVDVSGLTDGVPTAATFTWTNANGTSDVLNMVLEAEGTEAAPLPPDVNYLINGTGTEATIYLDTPEDFTGSAISEFTYDIDGGTPVVVSGAGPLSLTSLAATQEFTVAWANAGGYSDPVTIDLIASPPTYDVGDWTLTDAVDPAGDVLLAEIVTPLTVPGTIVLLDTEYRVDGGAANTLAVSGEISTGTAEVEVGAQLRGLYNIGPGVWSDTKTATPTIFVPEPIQAAIRARGTGASSATSSTTHTFTNPAGAEIGDQVVFQIGFDGNPGTLTVASGTGWTLSTVHVGNNTDVSGLVAFKTLNGVGDSLVLTSSASEQSGYLSWALSTWGDDPIRAWGTQVGSNVPNTPNCDFGDTGPFIVVSGAFYSQSGTVQTSVSVPTGYDNFRNQNSATNGSASVRVCSSEKEVVGSSEDPGAYGVSVPDAVLLTMAFPPATSILPVTTINVVASAEAVDNGESLTFTANADGNAPITYTLAIAGLADQVIVAPTNAPVVFTVTEPTGSYSGTLTAENPAGSAFDTVSFTVAERLVIVPDAANPFQIVIEADSVIGGTPASYDLEWDLADASGALTEVTQAGPDFTVVFPASGAWRFRVRETGGAWSIYGYYAVQTVGGITYSAENVQAVQISPIALEAPVEMVPVTGKIPKVFEVQPPVATEIAGSVTHFLNGVMVDPSAFNGRGPEGWDSRTGGSAGLAALHDGFDQALINTSWPVSLPIGGTISKALSRPTALLRNADGGQGVRYGSIDQHSGLIITDALSTASPLQAPSAIIKHGAWTPGSIDLPGYQDMVDIVTATTLSTAGMTVPSMSSLIQKVCRFNPTGKLLRFGLWSDNDNECFVPFDWSFGSSVTNYYAYSTDEIAYAALLSDALTSDEKIAILRYSIMRGVQQDFPGNDARTGAGISQDYMMPVALSRIARGESFLDFGEYDPGVSQRENMPWNYGFWDSTTVTYLAPHDSYSRPTFSLRRQINSITTDGTGHTINVPFNVNSRQGERQQKFGRLMVVHEATGNKVPHAIDSGQRGGPTTNLRTDGLFPVTPSPGDWVYMEIPTAAMGAFAEGEPYWMYDTEQDAPLNFRWQSFNPVPHMSYRNKQEPFGGMMLLEALGAYPNIPGSKWDAAKQYHLKAALPDWPTADFNYPFSAGTFVGQFWAAHAATLGITL
jgi:hypothetical protein